MTAQQRTKQEILQRIKALTNCGRHLEAMGLYQRHFRSGPDGVRSRVSPAQQSMR